MRTVLSTPRRPSFRLGFTPAAQARFNVISRSLTAYQQEIQTMLDQLYATESAPAQRTQWQNSLDALMGEADALVTASAVAEDSSLDAMLQAIEGISERMRAVGNQVAAARTGSSPERSAQRGWLFGAGAVVLGLVAGFAWLSFSKRS